MDKERFKLIPAVHIILLRDGKVLMLRRFNTGWMDGRYSLIAGHFDGGETARHAAAREAMEEAAVRIDEEDLEFAHVMHRHSDTERVDFFFVARKWSGEPRNAEPNKCDWMGWFPVGSMPDNTVPYIRLALENVEMGVKYSEFEWPLDQ